MSDMPLHPALVHIPVGLAFVIPLIAIAVAVAIWRQLLPQKAWAVVVVLQLVAVGGGFAALYTGEAEEDHVERVVGEHAIEHHEQSAKTFVIGAAVGLALGILGLFLKQPRATRAAMLGATAAAIVVAGLAYSVGESGGQLVYRHGAAQVYVQKSAAAGALLLPEEQEASALEPKEKDEEEEDDD